MDPGTLEPRGLVGTAQRTLRILEAVAESGDGTTAKAVARRVGCGLSTVYEYLNTLVYEGYLVRLQGVGGYGLGWRSAALHAGSFKNFSIAALYDLHQQIAAPLYVIRFTAERPEVASVLDSPAYPGIAKAEIAGYMDSVHASALGRIFLAALPSKSLERYLDGAGMKRLTPATPTRLGVLREKIAEIYATGISFESEEFAPGLVCVAAPVFGRASGSISGALAIATSRQHFTVRGRAIEDAARHAAVRLSVGNRRAAAREFSDFPLA